MIGLALLLAAAQAAPVPAPTLGTIGKQALPAKGCAAYLWSAGDRQLVAMAVADPATIRLSVDGKTQDFARTEQQGAEALGFDTTTRYAGGDVIATLQMSVVPRENLTAGAQVPTGTLTVERTGRDALVMPIAGLVGCAS